MISFESFVPTDSGPIYMQIILYIKRGLAGGTIVCHDELPSRRVLSSLLGINPNTVQKAYRILEEEGLIETRSGSKSCISASGEQIESVRQNLLRSQLEQTVFSLKQLGIDKKTAVGLLEKLWQEDDREEEYR